MARLRSIPRKIVRFARFAPGRRALLIEAALWLAVARLALLFLPFQWIAGHLGELVSHTDAASTTVSGTSPDDPRSAREVSWAVGCAAQNLPFKAVCLPQAIAAKAMLKRRHTSCVLHFGIAKGVVKPLDAHAWLDAAGVEVTGYPIAAMFTEVARFV